MAFIISLRTFFPNLLCFLNSHPMNGILGFCLACDCVKGDDVRSLRSNTKGIDLRSREGSRVCHCLY